MAFADLLLAIDAGGSSTRAVIVRADGAVLGHGRGGPGNHTLVAWDTIRGSYRDAVDGACSQAGVALSAVAMAAAGSAGVGPAGELGDAIEALLRELRVTVPALVTGDMVSALWGALPEPVGVVVCAGTGSVCFGRTASGASRQVGGWGPLMGDEGSAHAIGVQALQAVARAADGRGQPTTLCDILSRLLGVDGPVAIAMRVYGEPLGREQIAALAPHVASAAERGDAVSRRILRQAGQELGLAAVTAMQALALAHGAPRVAYSGAVFDAGALVLDAFGATVHQQVPAARICAPLLPPLGGVIRLGFERLGCACGPDVIERLQTELHEVGI